MQKRIASVWFPNWRLTAWRRRNPSVERASPASRVSSPQAGEERGPDEAGPFALVATERSARRLVAVNDAAEAAGLHPGKTVADAVALVPDLRTADHDPDADRQSLLALADWAERFSPAVAPDDLDDLDGLDGLFIDVTGGAAPWGGEAAWARDLLGRLERAGAPARLAIADTAGAAWALARFGEGDRTLLPPGTGAEALASLPVAALRLEPEAAAGLPRLGLTTVGQLIDLPRAELGRRFGARTLLRLDQALGRADEALRFRRPPTPWWERLAFVDPLSAPEDLARAAGDLLEALCRRLAAEGQGARRFELLFHRADGRSLPVRVGTGRPARDPARLMKLFAPKLEFVDPGFGVDAASLHADRLELLPERQARLEGEALEAEEAVAALVDQLGNRLGPGRVWRAAPFESHIPERAVARAPASAPAPAAGWDPERPRPLRLLPRPEPVQALAIAPDDPPAVFTWRGRRRRVRRAEGPERIAEEWWLDVRRVPDPGRVRDYYAVEDEAGERFWLFRDGLFGGPETPRWYMHGLFG